MEKETTSKILGQRLRKFRIAHGWSQADLAEKANTSSQNISKLEREGIKSTDDINLYSDLLGTDLWKNEIDTEGPVGEIGMEILIELVKHHGYLGFGELITEHLHGLNQEQAVNEVMKLMNIGLCIREIYTDFDDVERDGIFITAKGLITARNKISNPLIAEEIKDEIKKVKTYEQALEGAVNYQDYFDSRPLEKRLHALQSETSWRFDYFLYLKTTFEHGKFAEYSQIKEKHVCLFPAISFRMFIINAMMIGLSQKTLQDYYIKYEGRSIANCYGPNRNSYTGDLYKTSYDEIISHKEPPMKLDSSAKKTASQNAKLVHLHLDWPLCQLEYLYPWAQEIQSKKRDEEMQQMVQNGEFDDVPGFFIPEKSLDEICKENYMKRYEKTGEFRSDAMFTYEEYEAFIKENILPAETEDEKNLSKELKELNKIYPETLEYYDFPEEWEARGLADYVRSVYGIEKTKK